MTGDGPGGTTATGGADRKPKAASRPRKGGPGRSRSHVDTVIDHGGLLWRPLTASSVSGAAFMAARTVMLEIAEQSVWNPWVREDRQAEFNEASDVFAQWTRAEPDFEPATCDVEAWLAEGHRQFEAKWVQRMERRDRNRMQHDPVRSAARLEILEHSAHGAVVRNEADGLRTRRLYPSMPEERREQQLAELDASLARIQDSVDSLTASVGDVDTIFNADGSLPQERRDDALHSFRLHREQEVRRLLREITDATDALTSTKGRAARAKIRAKLASRGQLLQRWIDVEPQAVNDMCPDCPWPALWHIDATVSPVGLVMCPSWPRWSERVRTALSRFAAVVPPTPPTPAPPMPIAVIPSGLPIADVLARLTEIQLAHPDAEVRRGSRNRWEVWPGMASKSTPSNIAH